jgi:hypothetical protein
LGLCICQSLVQGMGGRIWLHSVVQKGTSFFFTVRLGVPAQDSVANDQVEEAPFFLGTSENSGRPSWVVKELAFVDTRCWLVFRLYLLLPSIIMKRPKGWLLAKLFRSFHCH